MTGENSQCRAIRPGHWGDDYVVDVSELSHIAGCEQAETTIFGIDVLISAIALPSGTRIG
jgi:hypothetical protein